MKFLKLTLVTISILTLLAIILNLLYPLNIDRLNKPKSTTIYDDNNRTIAIKLSSDGYLRIVLKKDEINQSIKTVVIGYEDRYFYRHFGINPLAIIRAIWFNITNKRTIGASTITMQVARMMHHKSRTLTQKLIEIFQAFQLEWYYTKDEILMFYLNNAPYGGNVEGFASASFRYFNLPPSSLSLAEIAYLTAIPKNPNHNRPKKGRNIDRVKNRALKRLYHLHIISKKSYQRAVAEKIVSKIYPLPNQIPHLRAKLHQEGEIYTTINIPLQTRVLSILQQQLKEVEKFHIYNASAIIIENRSMKIKAYVGSNNFYDTIHGGQNNGLTSLISPGSTLKPLVYAKALEVGLITPLKKVFDVPLFIEGYRPSNYSKRYLGEVTATEALQLSLNIPAVELDRLLHNDSLYTILKKANIPSITHKKSYYGASLTLGGVGLSLKEIAQLFAMFANGGVYQETSYFQNFNYKKPIPLLKKSSTYLVSNILANAPRSSFSATWEQIKNMKKIAFKTGTSAHAKDMLTIGYTPKYTVAVWFGNFSGESAKPYHGVYPSGLKVASPTLFEIFSNLEDSRWFSKPKEIEKREICQDPIVLKECKEKITDHLIRGIKIKSECQLMRAEVLSYLQKQHYINSISDLKNHRCYQEWRGYKPLITSPINEKQYIRNKLLPNELKETKLECFSFEENSTIYWLIDQQPPIVAQSGKAIYNYLEPKKHTISCLDEGAKMRTINFFNIER